MALAMTNNDCCCVPTFFGAETHLGAGVLSAFVFPSGTDTYMLNVTLVAKL